MFLYQKKYRIYIYIYIRNAMSAMLQHNCYAIKFQKSDEMSRQRQWHLLG